jgi:hypothetical protein
MLASKGAGLGPSGMQMSSILVDDDIAVAVIDALTSQICVVDPDGVIGQTPNPELEACRTTGLMALQGTQPRNQRHNTRCRRNDSCEGEHESRGHPDPDDRNRRCLSRKREARYAQDIFMLDRREGESAVDVLHRQVGPLVR